MKILDSPIQHVDILPAHGVEFPVPVPPEALPYTVAIRNRAPQTIALIGVRFEMRGPRAEKYSVVHYADMLRDPSSAELHPGCVRAICAEPSYTARKPDTRGAMNLKNLARMLSIEASLDCVAFEDGRFEGPDSRAAFDRINLGRKAESELIEATLQAKDPRALLTRIAAKTNDDRAGIALARKLLEAGDGIVEAAIAHRCRIALWRY